MDLQQYLHAVRAYWWAIALPLAVGLVAGAVLTARAEPQHRASLTFFVATSGGDPASAAAVQGDEFAQRRVNSYLELLTTDRLAAAVAEESGLGLTPNQVEAMMGAEADVDTVLLTATVTAGSRATVTAVADAVATEFVELVQDLETPGDGPASVDLELVSGPTVTEVPPRRALTVGVPALTGLALGLGLAWLLELRDKRIRSDVELDDLGLAPVLGRVPVDRQLREGAGRDPALRSPGAEAFRQVRTNLEFIDVNRPAQVLVITSPSAGDGKTTTTVNLALALAAAERSVLVVEGDLRRPTLVDWFPTTDAAGLTDVIVGHTDVDAALQPAGADGVTVLHSGPLPPNPSELLGSEAMGELLKTLRDRFDVVVINTPPLLPVTDAAVLAAQADGVVVVVRAGRTTRHQAIQALRSLRAVGARVLGTVYNMVPAARGSAYTS